MVTRGRSGEGAGKQMSKEAREVMLRSHCHTRSNKAQKAGQHKWYKRHKRHRSEENRRRPTKRRKSLEGDKLDEMQEETRADDVFRQMRVEFLQQEGGQLWRLFVCYPQSDEQPLLKLFARDRPAPRVAPKI
jgi:hypothetical protein